MDFKRALFISIISHCFILTPLGNLGIFSQNKKINELQVNYYKAPPIKAEIHKEIDIKKPAEAPRPAQTPNEQKSPPSAEQRQLKQKPQIVKKIKRPPAAEKPQEMPPPKNENIIPESIPGTTLPNTPECVSYYQYIREEIRRFLKRNYTSAYEEGNISISFSLNQAGELFEIEIIDEKSSKDSQLRRLSYESIKSSTPFKPFPKGLPQKEISFTLSIVFKHK